MFVHEGGQYLDYGLMSLHSLLSIQEARPKIVIAPCMLILGDSSVVVMSILGYTGGQYFDYASEQPCYFHIIHHSRPKIIDTLLTLISWMWH